MKVFFDTNVWVANFATRGFCEDLVKFTVGLHDQTDFFLLTCPAVHRETARILRDKFGLGTTDLHRIDIIFSRLQTVPDGDWQAPADFPDPDDVPIVGAALGAGAGLFVTGDKALLALDRIEGLPVRSPRDAYLSLRGLQTDH